MNPCDDSRDQSPSVDAASDARPLRFPTTTVPPTFRSTQMTPLLTDASHRRDTDVSMS